MKRISAVVLTSVSLLAACDDGAPEVIVLEAVAAPPAQAAVGQPVTASVRARRGQGNASGTTVTWTVEAGGGSINPTTTVTDAEGLAQATWTMGNMPGNNVASATIDGDTVRFTVVTVPDSPFNIAIVSGDAQTAEVGQLLRDSLVVRVSDRFGNASASITVTFVTNDGTVTPSTVLTSPDGRAVVRWRLSTRAGAQRLTAAMDATRSVEIRATASPGPMTTGSITAPTTPLTAGDSVHLQFVGRDQFGNPITNAPATFSSSDTTVAVITANNAVRGMIAGTVRITAQSGQVTAVVDLTFGPFRYTRLVAGTDHTCATAADTRLYCFGGGAQGQLGAGDTNDRTLPAPVTGGLTFSRISANAFFTCATATTQRMHCWGRNQEAQIGNGSATLTPVTAPAAVTTSETFTQVTTRGTSACGLTGNNRVLCWGGGDLNIVERASGIAFVTIAGSPVNGHACGLIADGTAYCWGRNDVGQLGNSTVDDSATPEAVIGGPFATIAVGTEHTCALAVDGDLYCWGRGDLGQLGYLSSTTDPLEGCGPSVCRKIPTLVPTPVSFVFLSSFGSSNCAIGLDDESYCWGRDDGQLGNTVANVSQCNRLCDPTPTLVETPFRFTSIAVGGTHSCALRSDGDLFCWGANDLGQLGRAQRSAAGVLELPAPVHAPRR
jgi:alpha-tubulin suppressor-like RCC1 family protein